MSFFSPTSFSPAMRSLWDALGWTMLHFLWAGALAALLARVALWAVRRRSPQLRYVAALAAFLLLALTPALLFAWRIADSAAATSRMPVMATTDTNETTRETRGRIPDNQAAFRGRPSQMDDGQKMHAQEISISTKGPVGRSESVAAIPAAEELRRVVGQSYAIAVGVLPWLWVCGFPFACVWILIGVTGTERLRRRCRPLENGEWLALCRLLRKKLGLRVPVQFAICDRLAVPLLIGIVRPLVLLPASAVCGYSPEQVEMIVLHELAHVRRWDNLVNLLQRLVEAVLFFHPAVWWLSRRVRLEREHCCDAVVLAHTRAPERYAAFLAQIALPGVFPQKALGVSAGEQLVARIRHILNQENEPMKVSRSLVIAVFAFFIALISVGLAWPNIKSSAVAAAIDEPRPAARPDGQIAIPTPHQNSAAIGKDPRVGKLAQATSPGPKESPNAGSAEWQSVKKGVSAKSPDPTFPPPQVGAPSQFGADGSDENAERDSKENALTSLDHAKVMSFQFRNRPWTAVLAQFAAETHLQLRLEAVPQGVFSRWDPARYSPSQTLTILNNELAPTGCQLKVEGNVLWVYAVPFGLGRSQSPAPVPPGEKGRLRFAGQTFEQWQTVLMTELDPKMRAEALAALGRFGASGYEDEASAAIAEFLSKARLIRTDEGDQKVEEAAAVAFMRIGPKALKTTVKLLKDKSPGVRRLATAIESSLMRDAPDPQPSAVEALVEATSDPDKQVRLAALQALVQIFRPRKASERNVLVSATMSRLQDNAAEIRRDAANVLAQLGTSAARAIPALLVALKDPRNEETEILDFGVLTSVIDALRRCGAPPATLVPALVELLPKAQADFRTLAHIAIVLGSLRSQAASAVPALIDALKRADQTEFRGITGELQSGHHPNAVELIATCLGEIGPTPDSPLVRTVLLGELAKLLDPNSKRHDPPTKDAIEAIQQAMRTLFPREPERIK